MASWSVLFEDGKELEHVAVESSFKAVSGNCNLKQNLPLSESDRGRFSLKICMMLQSMWSYRSRVFYAGGVKF